LYRLDRQGECLLDRVYEYFIGEFASSEEEARREYFTPAGIVRTLVAMLELEMRARTVFSDGTVVLH